MALVRNLKRFIFAAFFSFVILATIHRPTQETVSWAIHESESYLPNPLKGQLQAGTRGNSGQTILQTTGAQNTQGKEDETYSKYKVPETGKAPLGTHPLKRPEQIPGNGQDLSRSQAPAKNDDDLLTLELEGPGRLPGASPPNNHNPKSPDLFEQTNPQLGKSTQSSAQSHHNADVTKINPAANPNPVFQQADNSGQISGLDCPSLAAGPIHLTETIMQKGNEDVRLLLGVMSSSSSQRKEIMRTAYSRLPKQLNVDVIFGEANVECPTSKDSRKNMPLRNNAPSYDNCAEKYAKTYQYLRKTGLESGEKYTHVMETDETTFVNIPALIRVLRSNTMQKEVYWTGSAKEGWGLPNKKTLGSGYILSMNLVKWLVTSIPAPDSNIWTAEDFESCVNSHLERFHIANQTAFSRMPTPDPGRSLNAPFLLENETYMYQRWTLVTQNLKEDSLWAKTAQYYADLEWN